PTAGHLRHRLVRNDQAQRKDQSDSGAQLLVHALSLSVKLNVLGKRIHQVATTPPDFRTVSRVRFGACDLRTRAPTFYPTADRDWTSPQVEYLKFVRARRVTSIIP